MLNCINDRRMMFCALYKYLNSDSRCYCASFVHPAREHYYDSNVVINFTSIDPGSKNPDNPDLVTLHVWISFHHGMVILDPATNEMMIVSENKLELYKMVDGYWTTQFVVDHELESKQLQDIYYDRIFQPAFDLKQNLIKKISDKKYDEAVDDFCKETEEKMRILSPYYIIDPICNWRVKRAMKDCRYITTLGLIELMKRLSTHLDKLYIPTTVDGGANIKTDFQTFTDEFEVYWMKMYHSSTEYRISAFFCLCHDNGTIRLTVPGFAEDIEIIQVDARTFICMPFPEVKTGEMDNLKSLADERWCQIFRQELVEYLNKVNTNNEYSKGENTNA